jgi:hypothetical protein
MSVLEHTIAKAEGNQNDSNVNGTLHILVYAADAKSTALLVARNGIATEANAVKTKYTFTSRQQNAGQNYNIKEN